MFKKIKNIKTKENKMKLLKNILALTGVIKWN